MDTVRRPRPAFLAALLIAALLVGFGGAVLGAGVTYLALRPDGKASAAPPAPDSAGETQSMNVEIETALTDSVDRIAPAVVTVVNHMRSASTPLGGSAQPTASGSGVIIDADGYVVTNNHVVENSASLEVVLASGETRTAEFVGSDPFSDIAVLRVEGPLPASAPWGNSDALRPGEPVIAIGSPLGEFTNTVTVGVVSATGRSIETSSGYRMKDLIQTDAAINRGKSGGPLVNLAGQVVGINTLVVRGNGLSDVAEGLGFAIASNSARAVADQIIREGHVARPYLGIRWAWISPQAAMLNRLPLKNGVYLREVSRGGPAAEAGLQPGDIITAIAGVELDEDHPFINELLGHKPGETVEVTYWRGGEILQTQVILGERPQS